MSKFCQNISMKAIVIIVIASGIFFSASAANKAPKKQPAPHSNNFHIVSIKNMAYSPAKISISAGDTILWKNDDTVPHTVTSDADTLLHSQLFNPKQTYQFIFKNIGKFNYHCLVHPTMIGTVTVK